MKKFLDLSKTFSLSNQKLFKIRPVALSDIQKLREWKNRNREFFHLKQEITPSQQEAWYEKFSQKELQTILVCETDSVLIACVGFRKQNLNSKQAELFNLILGEESFAGMGLARVFFQKCREALESSGHEEIWLEVLKTNTKAIEWYLKQGFEKQTNRDEADFWILSLKL